ncbi:MAG: 4'-phosphopantetheinyl transferase superfamily protein [Flammeovirgaceae bacterium]|nr:MAG: 4'-phosphopantetheinyl transferase superfamily protein [Flammeovirgaceae bacterium]
MPITKIEVSKERAWGVWKIEEDELGLVEQTNGLDCIPENIRHSGKRLEYIAGRVLVKHLMEKANLPFTGLTKDAYGKPLLKNCSWHVSLTHSFPLVAAVLDAKNSPGIDLEQVNPKLLRMAPRIFHITELRDAGNDVIKHTVYWCGKETLMKIYGRRDVVFAENLLIEPFKLDNKGELRGRIVADNTQTHVTLRYYLFDNFVLVMNT